MAATARCSPSARWDELADAMRRILTDDALRETMKARALERAEEYGIAASNERFARCVEQLVSAGR